ncbi:hypothetical protein P7C73_g6433, partial [Tremellales sp. Uapishka_1]
MHASTPLVQLVLVPFLLGSAFAHIALWDEAMYGFDPSDPNQSEPVTPLMHLDFDQWWFHGYVDSPPATGKIMNLPAGGSYHGQVACNKALTSLGDNPSQQTGLYACDGAGPTGGIGALHTSDAWASPDPQDVKGCAIGIAYESDVTKVQPQDFTVISVNYTCPWYKNVTFDIPADLPPCPEGGCHCMWGWIHADDAGSEQMYMLGYRCNVTGATGTTPLPSANTANICDYPTDTSNCTVGAKQPHYWFQNERNNNFQDTYEPPFYNGAYGFMNGAQTDLFAGAGTNGTSVNRTAVASSNFGANSTTSSAIPTSSASSISSSIFSSSIATSSSAESSSSASSSPSATSSSPTQSTLSVAALVQAPISTSISSSSASSSTSSTACKRRKRDLSLHTKNLLRERREMAAVRAGR